MNSNQVKEKVKERYTKIAEGTIKSCCDSTTSCESTYTTDTMAQSYSASDLQGTPEGSNLGLGCGTPVSFLDLHEGNTILDLGSGAGIDAFIAARKVGPTGRVIGVDMTPQMIEKAQENARKIAAENVEFRLGEIENLPVETGSIDWVISNCVINLVPDKGRVFREIHRVLRPGGSFVVSDIVSIGEIPEAVKRDMELWAGCVAGALKKELYLEIIERCGFEKIKILSERAYDYLRTQEYSLASITVSARKKK
jgi:arsenite methyltransferase